MAICVAASGIVKTVAASAFILSWTHSVEKTLWTEAWLAVDGGLRLVEARVKGSGAGMDPAPGAVLRDGWWVWEPLETVVPELILAASGMTGGGWELCAAASCQAIGASAGEPVRIYPCDEPEQ